MTDSIEKVMLRHLVQLKKEMRSYPNESDIWITTGEISNTAGNLCLHLCGNLQHFVGSILGNSGYIRKRDEEFSLKNIPIAQLENEIDTTIDVIKETLSKLSEEEVKANYPVELFGEPMTTEYFLIHLTSHLGYHLGQINYHRRIIAAG